MDSVHFALALERYDLTVHQPHPPGYFLYVMLGRLIHLFIKDANAALVIMSVIFSGLTVAVIYLLAEDMYDRKTGIITSCLAITSPNLWFHGEIALSYGAEAFFSALVGLLCWKVYMGRYGYIWPSAISLGIAGGIRQNTVVFLLPLLLFAARKAPPWKIVAALVLLGAVCAAWLAPMVWMTGGWDAYTAAFRELWEFNTGHNSVFDRGWQIFNLYSRALYNFTIYSIGAGILAIGLAAYIRLRQGSTWTTSSKTGYVAVWILPSFFFYLLIFIHPANPGYALIFTPALLVVAARATMYVGGDLKRLTGKDITLLLTSVILLINTWIFMFSTYPVSWRTIKNHDDNLATIITELRSFDPSTTVFFALPYIFYGFRQVMYYLPQYRVYQVDVTRSPSGEKQNIFWGIGRDTFVSKEVVLPAHINCIATVLIEDDRKLVNGKKGITIRPVLPQIAVASGPIDPLRQIYPGLTVTLSEDPM